MQWAAGVFCVVVPMCCEDGSINCSTKRSSQGSLPMMTFVLPPVSCVASGCVCCLRSPCMRLILLSHLAVCSVQHKLAACSSPRYPSYGMSPALT